MIRKRTIFGAFLMLPFAGCAEQKEAEPPKTPTQIIEGFVLQNFSGGKLDWKLQAKEAAIQESAQKAQLSAPTVFFSHASTPTVLQANTGEVDLETHLLEAWGDVVVISGRDGSILKTQRLQYDEKTKKITSQESVWIKRGNTVTQGDGFESTPDLSKILIKNSRLSGNP